MKVRDQELKPCPFCGSADIDPEGWMNGEGVKGPACNDCGASAGEIAKTTDENIAAWNTRASQPQEGEAWREVAAAPKDGTLLRLLVRPDDEAHTSFEDRETPYETIGFNFLADTGDDEWQFAGWDWCHDCITQGYGEVIGWMPFCSNPRTIGGIEHADIVRVVEEVLRIPSSGRVSASEIAEIIADALAHPPTESPHPEVVEGLPQKLREFHEHLVPAAGEYASEMETLSAADRIEQLEREKAEAVEACAPLARLRVPEKPTGNAGLYSIRHDDIRRARTIAEGE